MKLPFYIARRYVFSKKTHNVINIISGISVFGITVSTMAMVVVLSGFNGIEHFIEDMYSGFDPDYKISKVKGKTFHREDLSKEDLMQIKGVNNASFVIEETSILRSAEKNWVLGKMKGVEQSYIDMIGVKDFVQYGRADIYDKEYPLAIMGYALLRELGTYVKSGGGYQNIKVIGLLGDQKLIKAREDALNEQIIGVGGEFYANPKYDNSYFLVPLDFAASLLGYEDRITSIELDVNDEIDQKDLKNDLQKLVGEDYKVEDKFDQNELLFSTHRTEKWITFLILCFIFVLATFNMIASLTMLVLDKRKDIKTLRALGMNIQDVRKIFIYEGLLINFIGAFLGISTGLLIAYGQQTYGWIQMGSQTYVDAYPIKILWRDVFWIFGMILLVGVATTYVPVRLLLRKSNI